MPPTTSVNSDWLYAAEMIKDKIEELNDDPTQFGADDLFTALLSLRGLTVSSVCPPEFRKVVNGIGNDFSHHDKFRAALGLISLYLEQAAGIEANWWREQAGFVVRQIKHIQPEYSGSGSQDVIYCLGLLLGLGKSPHCNKIFEQSLVSVRIEQAEWTAAAQAAFDTLKTHGLKQ